MGVSVVMPALEMAQETGKLVAWLKKEGEHVRKGDMLLEVETDKAVVEIEASGDGILGGVTAKPGDVIQVGRTIAWLLQPGETPPLASAAPASGRTMSSPAASVSATPAGPAPAAGGARLSPKARKLAQERGVDVASLKGSGPGGERDHAGRHHCGGKEGRARGRRPWLAEAAKQRRRPPFDR